MGKNQISLLCLVLLCAFLLMRQAAAQDLYVGSNSSGETTTFSLGTNVYGNIFVGYTASDSGNTLQLFNPGTILIDNVGIFIGCLSDRE